MGGELAVIVAPHLPPIGLHCAALLWCISASVCATYTATLVPPYLTPAPRPPCCSHPAPPPPRHEGGMLAVPPVWGRGSTRVHRLCSHIHVQHAGASQRHHCHDLQSWANSWGSQCAACVRLVLPSSAPDTLWCMSAFQHLWARACYTATLPRDLPCTVHCFAPPVPWPTHPCSACSRPS